MRVNQADLHEFEVDHEEDSFVVNIETCGCCRWNLLGIPCWNALACIQLRRLNFEDFIHPAYHIETYAKAYAPAYRAMLGQNQWEVTPHPRPLPHPRRNMPGRPSKKKRVKEVGEDKDREQLKRAKRQNKCSRCGGLGHYKTNCINPSQPTNAQSLKVEGQNLSLLLLQLLVLLQLLQQLLLLLVKLLIKLLRRRGEKESLHKVIVSTHTSTTFTNLNACYCSFLMVTDL
ncbi:Protein lin-28-like protein A [Bienertia sinuspersici]